MAWTSHGHHISGSTITEHRPEKVARCGGPGLCRECSREASLWTNRNKPEEAPPSFLQELTSLINKHSLEGMSDTPDFILASFLQNVLTDWNHATRARDAWKYSNMKGAIDG
jgi:hypothetical protein